MLESMPLSSTSFLIFSACAVHFPRSESSLRVLRRMFNWVTSRLLICEDDPLALRGEDTGEPALVDSEMDGECRVNLVGPPPVLPPDDKLASEAARRGLPEDARLRERLPVRNGLIEGVAVVAGAVAWSLEV